MYNFKGYNVGLDMGVKMKEHHIMCQNILRLSSLKLHFSLVCRGFQELVIFCCSKLILY